MIAAIVLVGVGISTWRTLTGRGPSELVLGALPFALLAVPVQVLLGLWELLVRFKTIAASGSGGTAAIFALCLEHQRAWASAAWIGVAALALSGLMQTSALRVPHASEAASAATDSPFAWPDFARVVSALMALPVAVVSLSGQHIEAQVMALLGSSAGVRPPAHFPSVAGFGVRQLGEAIGSHAVYAMLGGAIVIAVLLALAVANMFGARHRAPGWLVALSWVALLTVGGALSADALRMQDAVRWGERVLPRLETPKAEARPDPGSR